MKQRKRQALPRARCPERDRLVALATERFGGELSASELRVVEDAALGEVTMLGDDDPAGAAGWPADRALKPALLRWLLTNATAATLLSARGVKIVGARVDDVLVLSGAQVKVRVNLHSCALKRVVLHDSRIETFSLEGSHCDGLGAQRLHVRGALFLDDDESARRFVCRGQVDFTGAQIEGVLKCRNARLSCGSDPERVALVLVRARIGGSVFLDEGIEVAGKVDLTSAKIGGSLRFSNGTVESPTGAAIEADRLEVAHSVYLDRGFKSFGSVELTDSKIDHNLKCAGGSIDAGRDEFALNASRIEIAGGVRFGGTDVQLIGRIVLSDAHIGGSLELIGLSAAPRFELYRTRVGTDVTVVDVHFGPVVHAGLIASDAKVDGELRWRNVSAADGAQLDLTGAYVATLDDCPHEWGPHTRIEALYDGLTYLRIEHASSDKQIGARIGWLNGTSAQSASGEGTFSPQPYNQLAATLRESGHDGLAIKVAMAREDDRRRRGELTWGGKLWAGVLKAVLGSGYRPARALLWSVGFILIGAAVFRVAEDRGQFGYLVEKPKLRPAFNPVVYSADAFLPISDLQQERFRAPRKRTFARYYLWVHVTLGWVLVTLGLVGVTGLVRRE